MIYCTYSTETNALLGVSTSEPTSSPGQEVIAHNRELPDFVLEEWNPALLSFFTKEETTWTHLEFRRRFTSDEQELIDEFNATFESNPALTAAQKRKVRTGLKNFDASTHIVKSDPDIPALLGLYTLVGLIASGRAAEILA